MLRVEHSLNALAEQDDGLNAEKGLLVAILTFLIFTWMDYYIFFLQHVSLLVLVVFVEYDVSISFLEKRALSCFMGH